MSDSLIRRIALAVAWTLLSAIVVVTLVPLSARPQLPAPAMLERLLPFMALGGAFALAGRRSNPLPVAGFLLVFVGGLEWLQTLTASRHGRVDDFVVKAIGVAIGAILGAAVRWLHRRQA